MSMVVGLLTVELHVPGSRSLKEKRMVLRRIKDRLKKFNVAVSEVEHQDLWQRASIGVVSAVISWPSGAGGRKPLHGRRRHERGRDHDQQQELIHVFHSPFQQSFSDVCPN